MTEIETIKQQIDQICQLAALIPVDDAVALVNELERMDSLMPVVDPTGWVKITGTIDGHKIAASGFLDFRRTLEKLKP